MNFEKFLRFITNQYFYNYPLHKSGRKYIFIHINKTGGTSVSKAFGFPGKLHLTAHETYNQVGQKNWEQAFKFSFVRNPFGKVLSHFRYRIHTKQLGNHEFNREDFNKWVANTYGVLVNNQYLEAPKMFKTHFDWLTIDCNSIAVDFCGRFENFESDFNIICHQIGLKKDIPHVNKISNDPVNYKEFYNRNSRNIVEEYFKKDLDIFNYSY